KPDSAAKRIWQQMTAEQQQTVAALTAQANPSAAQVSQLLASLNHVAGQPALHETAELQALSGPDAATIRAIRQSLAERFDAEQSRRLNKLLIASLFPGELHKARVNLLSVFT